MKLDPYMPCPCGSGKNLKWCCADDVSVYFQCSRMIQSGQNDLACRTMEALVGKKPGNARVLALLGRVYFDGGDVAKSLETADQALQIDPRLPAALFLRAMLRFGKGETESASKDLRLAAEHCPEKQMDTLPLIYGLTADLEARRWNYIPMRKALEREIQLDPSLANRKQMFREFFLSPNDLPKAATREYSLRQPSESRKVAWADRLKGVAGGRLLAAEEAYRALAEDDRTDLAARYNLALTRAWLGENLAAIAELDALIDDETDSETLNELAAMRAVLSVPPGCEEASDWLCHEIVYTVVDESIVNRALRTFIEGNRIISRDSDEESRTVLAMVTKPREGDPADIEKAVPLCTLILSPGMLLLQSHLAANIEQAKSEMEPMFGFGVQKPLRRLRYAGFEAPLDMFLRFSTNRESADPSRLLNVEAMTAYFEGEWLDLPLRALEGKSARQAIDDTRLKKRLEGIIAFWEAVELLSIGGDHSSIAPGGKPTLPYDFNGLRQKLGLPLASAPGV